MSTDDPIDFDKEIYTHTHIYTCMYVQKVFGFGGDLLWGQDGG